MPLSVGAARTEEWELQARLLQALKTNNIQELDFLLSDSSIDIADLRFFPHKRPAICISVEHGCYEITSFLLTLGANVNDQVYKA